MTHISFSFRQVRNEKRDESLAICNISRCSYTNIQTQENPETLTTFFSSGTKGLLTLLTFSFSTRRETDTIFTMLTVPTSSFSQPPVPKSRPESNLNSLPPTNAHPVASAGLPSTRFKSQLTAFFKNHQNSQLITFGHDVIHTPVSFPILGFYYDICDCHIPCARAWTPALRAE